MPFGLGGAIGGAARGLTGNKNKKSSPDAAGKGMSGLINKMRGPGIGPTPGGIADPIAGMKPSAPADMGQSFTPQAYGGADRTMGPIPPSFGGPSGMSSMSPMEQQGFDPRAAQMAAISALNQPAGPLGGPGQIPMNQQGPPMIGMNRMPGGPGMNEMRPPQNMGIGPSPAMMGNTPLNMGQTNQGGPMNLQNPNPMLNQNQPMNPQDMNRRRFGNFNQ